LNIITIEYNKYEYKYKYIYKGVITISGDSDNLGTILSVNSALCGMYGRLSSELVGSNVSILMPSPFSDTHNAFMRRYEDTGNHK